MHLRFTSSASDPVHIGFRAVASATAPAQPCSASPTQFYSQSATPSPVPVAYLDESCPGPTVIDLRQYQGLAMTRGATYTRGISCAVILYSGDDSRAVTVWPESANMALEDMVYFYEGQGVGQMLAGLSSNSNGLGEWRCVCWSERGARKWTCMPVKGSTTAVDRVGVVFGRAAREVLWIGTVFAGDHFRACVRRFASPSHWVCVCLY